MKNGSFDDEHQKVEDRTDFNPLVPVYLSGVVAHRFWTNQSAGNFQNRGSGQSVSVGIRKRGHALIECTRRGMEQRVRGETARG